MHLQIKREIETMKLIKHPNVVQLYEVSLSLSSRYATQQHVEPSFVQEIILRNSCVLSVMVGAAKLSLLQFEDKFN